MREETELLLLWAAVFGVIFGVPVLVAVLLRRRFKWGLLKSCLTGLAVFLGIWITIALVETPAQQKQEKEFTETELLPLANYVTAFRDAHGRLPSNDEFHKWSDKMYPNQLINYCDHQPRFSSKWGKPGEDFLVGKWEGEWVEYYRFSDRKSFEGPIGGE